MKKIKIVDCTKEYIDIICEIDRVSSCYNWTKKMFMDELDNKHSFFKILFLDDKIIGYIIYHIIIDEAEILDVVIYNEFKRQNLGKYLLEQTIGNILKQKVKIIFLEVSEKNIPAINLYLKLGFKQYGIRKNYYKNSETALLMKKIFND